ncbi:hypothetical protein NLJ89_g7895 [Agrocybe chaxingu]|uniref:Uncharacterized protein n=1 Tax=Agrocybe chaxingu TaxID=84603 RepID=A0A9W8K3H7_9AGAR|nr:hypothetical protein NLJ89_g7895 [Agrocybe chaxingu]
MSRAPHCCPYRQKVTKATTTGKGKNKQTIHKYYVMLKCAKDSKKPDDKVTIVPAFLVPRGPNAAAPSAAAVYNALIVNVGAMSSLPL